MIFRKSKKWVTVTGQHSTHGRIRLAWPLRLGWSRWHSCCRLAERCGAKVPVAWASVDYDKHTGQQDTRSSPLERGGGNEAMERGQHGGALRWRRRSMAVLKLEEREREGWGAGQLKKNRMGGWGSPGAKSSEVDGAPVAGLGQEVTRGVVAAFTCSIWKGGGAEEKLTMWRSPFIAVTERENGGGGLVASTRRYRGGSGSTSGRRSADNGLAAAAWAAASSMARRQQQGRETRD
jgi:hypothetical protein